jgi:hypothetical protein
MSFETKEQVLEKIMTQDKPNCPHCGLPMSLWEVPPMNFSDGLGWGTPYLYLCFNDECPMYVQGWKHLEETYSHKASYRCLCYPGTEQYECMPVFSPMGATGQIIDDEVLAQQEALRENTKKGFNLLATCITEHDWVAVVRILMDSTEPPRVRVKAAEIIGDFGEIEAIDPIRIIDLETRFCKKSAIKLSQKSTRDSLLVNALFVRKSSKAKLKSASTAARRLQEFSTAVSIFTHKQVH